MNIGVAMKVANLVLKHLTFEYLSDRDDLHIWLHVPCDKYTLEPLREAWRVDHGAPLIPRTPGMGFVRNLDIYFRLHSLVSGIVADAGKTRIIYEFWAWDARY